MNTQVVMITGGLTGIGRATALAFAKEGAQVVVSGRRDEDGKNLVAELRKLGAEAEFVRSDVRHEEDVCSLIDKTVARFGQLDAAVNCTGTEGTPGPVTEQTTETYAATFETNVLGTLLSMKHKLRAMLAQGRGSIVNVSSTYGHTGAAGASVYSASKHAVEGLTKSAALEDAASGIRVNRVAPGPIETGMLNRFAGTDERKAVLASTVPLKRVGKPEEIAQTIAFLSSDKASFITGASYLVDGGKTAQQLSILAARHTRSGWRIKMNRMIEEKNKELVLKAFDTLFNKRDYAAAERFWSPNYIQHSAHIEPGRDGLFKLIKSIPPTLKYEPGTIVAEKDFVIVHGRFSGIGLPVNWIAADIVRIKDGVLVEHWDVIEDEATQEQSKSGLPMFGDVFTK